MRIPAVLVVSVIVVLFAWSYGPAWAVFGAVAVGTFAVLGLRQRLRGARGARGARDDAAPAGDGGGGA